MPNHDNTDGPQIHQLRLIAVTLTMIGGFIDAYTFVQRGGALAAGQTGNLIFLSVDVAKHNLPGVFTKFITVIFFSIGVLTVTIFKHRHKTHYWRIPSLAIEFLVCLIVGFLPTSVANFFIVPPLALAMAMQTTAFSKIEGRAYNNVFSTGNLKKAMIAIGEYHYHHDQQQLTTALIFFELVGGFAGGAVISALLQRFWGPHTIWGACIALIVIAGYYARAVHRKVIRS
ncbi:YoaK family protein [Furfurilactobacillus entadae]|uniref:YoaK family protein n=1 Tax=Furfurilactobacillus entadae TaxID=2922307 RepID=UPI0035F0B17B